MPEEWIYRIGGTILLLFGSHAFWLMIMVAGFLFGFKASQQFWSEGGQWVGLMVAIFCGLMGGVLMYFLKRAAVFVVGFLCGGYLAYTGAQMLATEPNVLKIGFVVGGLIGGFCAAMVFEWAIIILTVLLGTTWIVQTTTFPPNVQRIFFIGLGLVGLAVQIFCTRAGAFAEHKEKKAE